MNYQSIILSSIYDIPKELTFRSSSPLYELVSIPRLIIGLVLLKVFIVREEPIPIENQRLF